MVSPVIYFDCCKTIINPEKPGKLTVRDENAPLECRSKKKKIIKVGIGSYVVVENKLVHLML